MDFLPRFWESPHFDMLKNSVEVRAKKWSLIEFLCLDIFWGLLLLIPDKDSVSKALFCLLYFLVMLPLTVWYVYRIVQIFLYPECYTFTEALLDQPHQNPNSGGRWSSGSLYFTVILRDRQGREIQVDTESIFSTSDPCFDDYVNKKALIGYNDKTQRVVVIKQLP